MSQPFQLFTLIKLRRTDCIWMALLLMIISIQLYSQPNEIENLKRELKNHPEQDTFRINRLNKLSEINILADLKEMDKISMEAWTLSHELGYVRGEVLSLLERSRVARYQGKRQQAIELLLQADSIAKKKNDVVLQFKVWIGLSLCYSEKDNRQSLFWALHADSLAQRIDNKKLISIAQYRASEIYTNLNDYAHAMDYVIKSQNNGMQANCFDCQVKSWGRIAHIYTLIGNYEMSNLYYQKQMKAYKEMQADNRLVAALYHCLGENYHRLEQKYPEALAHYFKALELDSGVARREVTYINLADVYLQMGDLPSSFKYANEALDLAKRSDDLVLQAWVEGILANSYLKKNKPDSALYFAKIGLSNAKSVSNVEHMCNNALAMANAYSIKNDFKNAFQFQKLYINYRDSILNTETKNKISVIERANEMERSQNAIALLNQQKKAQQNLLVAISIILLLVIITAIGLFRSNRQKTKYSHERQLLISTVQTQEDERKRIAQDLHDELGAVLSIARMHIVQIQDEKEKINLEAGLQQARTLTESALATMRRISHELMPPQLEQFGLVKTLRAIATQTNDAKKIELELIADDDLQRWPVLVERGLYRVCMEMINNTIKHADAKHIRIQLNQNHEYILFTYSDNGKGLPDNYSAGQGFKNIEARVNILAGTLRLGNNDGGGFSALLSIPLH